MDRSASGSRPTGGRIMNVAEPSGSAATAEFNLLKPTGYVMHQQV
jgi:hypothetical protein